MADKPFPEDEPGAIDRYERAIKRALATPPTPHTPKDGRQPKAAPKSKDT
jgi:hypothetical protein